jgi:hypothetical protein
MKRYVMFMLLFISLVSFGCSARDLQPTRIITSQDGTITKEMDPMVYLQVEMQAKKLEMQIKKQEQEDKRMATLKNSGASPAEILMATLAIKQSDDMKEMALGMVSAFTGKSVDGNTNMFDMMIAEVKSKNEALGKISDGFFSLGKFSVGGYFLSDTLKSLVASAGTQYNFNSAGDMNLDGSLNNITTTAFDGAVTIDLSRISETSTTTTF